MNRQHVTRVQRAAKRQRGMFTLQQAVNAGWDRWTIRRWLRAGVLTEPEPRVYCFGAAPLTWEDRLMALALSAGAIAARRSAAALYNLLSPVRDPHVVLTRGRRNLSRVHVHSTTDLAPSDITRVGPIPATTPTRTLIDVAAELSPSNVDRLVDRAVTRRLVRVAPLERRAIELRAPGRPGASRVLRSIAAAHPDLAWARNEFEAAVLRLSRATGLPDPIPNHLVEVGGRRRYLDVAWPTPMVFLEFDGYLPHVESRTVFDDDRLRQNELVDAGWTVFRFTSTMLGRNARREFEPVRRAVLAIESHASVISDIAV